ncbi:origin recognition complex subunit 2-domain-containing protein [Truncatella angustata]|uniref:Origin recognition complex subunit 2 n=1 Tax=Truncatella angustata TaxID=152316 RepID=A0A9P8UHB1_9PEZI|nr:origin recognition complex subunit 2-domain-containing protein [Truncatella angustata]KAH6652108.1 origin recognition complex subunit 2-domain-containing protein [Truncatella angustata]
MTRGEPAELDSADSVADLLPRKRARRAIPAEEAHGISQANAVAASPVKRKRGRPSAASRLESIAASANKSVYDVPSDEDGRNETPSQPSKSVANAETPSWRRNDRSARKKSARALIESVVAGNASDDDEEDQDIAREIYESSDEDDVDELGYRHQGQDDQETNDPSATPSRKSRGRSKGTATRARKKSPTPPPHLPPHELYFAQTRPGASKTSANSLAALQLLTHDEYFSIWNDYNDPHHEDVQFLQDLHADSFPQWVFELSQGFSICAYGFGSKRPLLQKFANHLYAATPDHVRNKIVIVNGYVRNTSIREILGTIGSAVDPSHKLPAGNPAALLDNINSLLSSHDINITIILNSIDSIPLRKPGMQAILAQLASHASVQLICSSDTPDFTLLWDSGLRSAFNFTFHDCTTFAPFSAEIDVVDDVHELLGRKARRVGGKEGVAYVLRSLPENAKSLFRLLVTEVLVAADDEGVFAGENPGVEYRMLYGKAVEEFICSSEMAFRTLLKEFHDHQMITSRKDVLGTELLSVPFRKEELEAMLEDLMV